MLILLDEEYHFSPRDDKTNFHVDFSVPEGFDVLCCECRYAPKEITDAELKREVITANIGKYIPREKLASYSAEEQTLVNLLTFSLDYEDKYIGCAHRHAPEMTHRISKEGSSPGFVSQGADAGNWHAVINIHSITSPVVTYSLKISAFKKEEVL